MKLNRQFIIEEAIDNVTLNIMPFDIKYLFVCLTYLAMIIILMKVTGGIAFAIAFMLLFLSVYQNNNEFLLYTLLIVIAITLSNSSIVIKSNIFAIEQRLLLISLSIIMIYRMTICKISGFLISFLSIFIYILYMIIPSMLGWCPIISYCKLFFFSMVYLAFLGVANSIINHPTISTRQIRSIFLMFAIYFIIGSLLLIPFSFGYLSGEALFEAINAGKDVISLFIGISIHSQTLGPICAMLGVMLYADLLFSIRRLNLLYLFLLIWVPFLIWKTSCRTAMGAFISGISFSTLCFMRTRDISQNWKLRLCSTMMIIIIVAIAVVFCLPQAFDKVTNFVLKSTEDHEKELSLDNMTSTRRALWDKAIDNFKMKPMIGNGFQVSEEMSGNGSDIANISTTIEKGVWIAAILEEGGLTGFMIFISSVLTVFSSLYKRKCYQGLSALFMILIINLGEFTLFSMSALGGFLWVLVFLSVIFDAQRKKDSSQELL